MAVPRPVLLALLGLGLIASLFLVTRSGSTESVRGPSKAASRPMPPPARSHKATVHKVAAPSAAKAHPAPAKADAARKPDAAPAKPHAPPAVKTPAPTTVQDRVLAAAQALAANEVVVFFFSNNGPADDAGARAAVESLRGVPGVHVFDANLDEVAAFRPMLSNVGISQVPSTVIVRPGRKAVLIQGFVDAGTLRQNVADALR